MSLYLSDILLQSQKLGKVFRALAQQHQGIFYVLYWKSYLNLKYAFLVTVIHDTFEVTW